MDKEEALRLLQGGREGIEEWNRRREEGEKIPRLCGLVICDFDLSYSNLKGVDFRGADLSRVSFRNADLRRARLRGANLTGASLLKANAADADLSRANLQGAILQGVNFGRSDLSRARLIDANLNSTNLIGADLNRALLNRASLSFGTRLDRANLRGANLRGADLTGANLRGANLSHARLIGTKFESAICAVTEFVCVDLSSAIGLDRVIHFGPSEMTISTLKLSKGKIPLLFFEGCGLADWEIEATKLYDPDLSDTERCETVNRIYSLQAQGIQFYSCFISYSHQNEEFAKRLHADLQEYGIRCWFAPEDLKIGDKVLSTIDDAIRLRDKLVLILSEHSINSDWVEHEVNKAIEEEKRRDTTVLFPIRIDDAVMETEFGWAKRIRSAHEPGGRHIGDFRGWKDEARYKATFERLRRDLTVEKKEDEDEARP